MVSNQMPDSARMTDEQIAQYILTRWDMVDQSCFLQGIQAAEDHAWAEFQKREQVLEPVLRELVAAAGRFIDGLHTKEMSILPTNIVLLSTALAAVRRTLDEHAKAQ